jgi:hypothetical protein
MRDGGVGEGAAHIHMLGEGKVERAKARVRARARSAASTRRTACKHAAYASGERRHAGRTRGEARTARTRAKRSVQGRTEWVTADDLNGGNPFRDKSCALFVADGTTCDPDLSRTHISSKETPPSGKYETIISKIFLKGYCLSERCATYVVFRLVFLRG